MQGIPFLGPKSETERETVYGTRDRVDEVMEMARSVRDKQFLYVRNYMPHLSYNQPSVFSDLGEIRNEITRMAKNNLAALTGPQRAYAGPGKPVEEFYDCVADPDNIVNLLAGELNPHSRPPCDASVQPTLKPAARSLTSALYRSP